MTNPPEPGQPQRRSAPGPYGPPPGPYGPPHQQQQQQPPSGHVPGPRPSGPGPQQQQQPDAWSPPEHTEKGLFGALFDANFNHLVTPKLIKVFYILSLMLITLSALIVVALGLWIWQLREGWLVGMLVVGSAPVIWIFEAILARIFMEAVVVRFKGVEHLRVIKDKI